MQIYPTTISFIVRKTGYTVRTPSLLMLLSPSHDSVFARAVPGTVPTNMICHPGVNVGDMTTQFGCAGEAFVAVLGG